MPLYISELTPAELETYYQSFYKKVDYALRSGTTCFANLVEQTMEDIDAMEIGGYPAYYPRRPLYDRPPPAQIQARRAAKRAARRAKRLESIKHILLTEGPKEMDALAARTIELLGDLLQEDAIVMELVGWVEEESGLLGMAATEAAEAAEAAAKDAAIAEIVDQLVEAAVAAAEAEAAAEAAAKEAAAEAEAAAAKAKAAAAKAAKDAEWPALPAGTSTPPRPKPKPAPAPPKPKPTKARRSCIQHLLQNPALLAGLPKPVLTLHPLFVPSK